MLSSTRNTLVSLRCGTLTLNKETGLVEADSRPGFLILSHSKGQSQLVLEWKLLKSNQLTSEKRISIDSSKHRAQKLKNQERVFAIKLSDNDIWFFWQQDEDQSLDDERLSQLNFYLTSYVPENASDSQNTSSSIQTKNPNDLKFRNLLKRDKLLPLLVNMSQQRKEILYEMLPKSDKVQKNDSTLIECLLSPSSFDTADLMNSVIQQQDCYVILKQLGFPESTAKMTSKTSNMTIFARSLEAEMKNKPGADAASNLDKSK